MFLIVVVIFGICWLPYHCYFIAYYHHAAIVKYEYIGEIFLSFYWLAMANTMVNPVIYYWMNTRFKLKYAFWKISNSTKKVIEVNKDYKCSHSYWTLGFVSTSSGYWFIYRDFFAARILEKNGKAGVLGTVLPCRLGTLMERQGILTVLYPMVVFALHWIDVVVSMKI